MTCKCKPCTYCKGTGDIWVDPFTGKVVTGIHDDMDELNTCEQCHGTGVGDMCDDCEAEYQEEIYKQSEQDGKPCVCGTFDKDGNELYCADLLDCASNRGPDSKMFNQLKGE